jgi:MFS family permease
VPGQSRTAGEATSPHADEQVRAVGWRFVALYAAAYMSTSLVFIAPLLVTLALKVNSLVPDSEAPGQLALVVGVGALVSLFANPFFGRMSDRTTSRLGRRRPWMVLGLVGGTLGILVVALAPSITVVLVGWCLAQLFFNALLAAQVAVLPDQVPPRQRGVVSGVLGTCVPIASVAATFLVDVFSGHQLAMFLAPCVVGGFFILLFATVLDDHRLSVADKPAWSLREFAGCFYFSPRKSPDFAWAFLSRFMFILAYAMLVTYQAYYLLHRVGSAKGDVPHQIFLGTLAQTAVVVVVSLLSGRLSDRTGRRKIFVVTASVGYGLALFVLAAATDVNGYLVGIALSGIGFGMYFAVDLALVADVLPDEQSTAKDLGVLNFAGALPFSVAPVIAPVVLAVSDGSYAALYVVAGTCAILGATAILRVRGVG